MQQLKQNYKSYWGNLWGYKLLTSMPFMLLQTAVAGVFFNLDMPMVSLWFFAIVLLMSMLTSKDLSPCLLPLLLVAMTLLKMYGSNVDTYKSIFPIGFTLIGLLVLRPLYLPVRWTKGAMFYALVGVSVGITLGGLGSLSWGEYFDLVPIFYVFTLGFGMLLSYLLMRNYTFSGGGYDAKDTFVKSMLCVGLMGVMMIMPVAIDAIVGGKSWGVQWSNNLSTFMIFAMPFTLYQSVRSRRRWLLWFVLGAVECLAILFTLSRGGIMFGFITYVISAAAAILTTNCHRRKFFIGIIILLAIGGAAMLFVDGTLQKLTSLLSITSNEARVNLIRVAIDNFAASPIFGAGLAYRGEFYNPQEWALYWYHSLPFQIIGSLGLVGVAGYGYLFYRRVRLTFVSMTKFNIFCQVSMLGFTLMGCVNPGEFAPVPYAVMITAIMVFVELENKKTKKPDDYYIIITNGKRRLNW